MRRRVVLGTIPSLLLILGGLLLLAFSSVRSVLPDPARTELPQVEEGLLSETSQVILAALLMAGGMGLLLELHSRAPHPKRELIVAGFTTALCTFLVLNFVLVINGIGVTLQDDRVIYFSASYLFHLGQQLSFMGVYILFFLNFLILLFLVGATAYLLFPTRFGRALFDPLSWAKNESIHIAATLFLLLSLSALFVFLLLLAIHTAPGSLHGHGLLAENLVPVYFVLAFVVFGLALTVATHAFLLNWGSGTTLEPLTLLESIRTIARIERALLAATLALNTLILFAPTLPSRLPLSNDFVFGFSPRGLAWFTYVLLSPYLFYHVSQRRLEFLIRAGRSLRSPAPFAERSLRMVLVQGGGLALLTAIGIPSHWEPLGLMLAFSAWTMGVLAYHAVEVKWNRGLPRLALRGEGALPLFYVAATLALTTGLMLWGSGNTFEVNYEQDPRNLVFLNDSSYGTDALARVTAMALIAGTIVLSLHLAIRTLGIQARFFAHYLGMFLSATVTALVAFTVGVWTEGDRGLADAKAGFAFRQYYAQEETIVALLIIATVLYLSYATGRIIGSLYQSRRGSLVVTAALPLKRE